MGQNILILPSLGAPLVSSWQTLQVSGKITLMAARKQTHVWVSALDHGAYKHIAEPWGCTAKLLFVYVEEGFFLVTNAWTLL